MLTITEQKDELSRIEDEIASVAEPDRIIYERYEELEVPKRLDELLLSRLRADTTVTLNYDAWAFSHRSSVLHRYLVYRLLKIDPNLRALPGKLMKVEGHEPDLIAYFDVDRQERIGKFNRVVVRHGPVSAMGRDFSKLNDAFRHTLGARNALDATRRPLWPDAPAARLALTSLSDAAVASLIDKLNIEWFKVQPIDANKLLRNLFASHINQVPDDKRELVQSFIDNGYFEFLEMHGQLEQE